MSAALAMKPFFQSFKIFLIGACMGTADLIPGVSGGTIAFICGIYERLLNSIKCFDLKMLRTLLSGRIKEVLQSIPFAFLIPLGLGILTTILTLSSLLDSLFETHPVQLWSFFFGLILGSIVFLFCETRPWKRSQWGIFLVATFITYWLVGLDATQTPPTPVYLFLSGCIAISAMILPGISGSYILVILGKYQQILDAVNSRDILSLAYFIAGMVVGVLSLVRLVSWLLKTWRQITIVALTGIMAGALRTVWPWKETLTTRIDSHDQVVPMTQQNVLPTDMGEIGTSILLLLAGAVVVLFLQRLNPSKTEAK